jgi:hypothetical protein
MIISVDGTPVYNQERELAVNMQPALGRQGSSNHLVVCQSMPDFINKALRNYSFLF